MQRAVDIGDEIYKRVDRQTGVVPPSFGGAGGYAMSIADDETITVDVTTIEELIFGGASEQGVDGIPAARSVRKGYGNAQPLYAAGITVDESLHPQGALGSSLWAAGEWIGGFDPARERTGLGTALLTGCEAGRRAAAHLGAGA